MGNIFNFDFNDSEFDRISAGNSDVMKNSFGMLMDIGFTLKDRGYSDDEIYTIFEALVGIDFRPTDKRTKLMLCSMFDVFSKTTDNFDDLMTAIHDIVGKAQKKHDL